MMTFLGLMPFGSQDTICVESFQEFFLFRFFQKHRKRCYRKVVFRNKHENIISKYTK